MICLDPADEFIRLSSDYATLLEKHNNLRKENEDMKERQNNLLKAIHEIQNEASALDEDAWLSDVVQAFHRELYSRR